MIIEFDDVVIRDGQARFWSQICVDCAQKYGLENLQDNGASDIICGVNGCSNEADYYYDFNAESESILGLVISKKEK